MWAGRLLTLSHSRRSSRKRQAANTGGQSAAQLRNKLGQRSLRVCCRQLAQIVNSSSMWQVRVQACHRQKVQVRRPLQQGLTQQLHWLCRVTAAVKQNSAVAQLDSSKREMKQRGSQRERDLDSRAQQMHQRAHSHCCSHPQQQLLLRTGSQVPLLNCQCMSHPLSKPPQVVVLQQHPALLMTC
jgi:hypothetical protein